MIESAVREVLVEAGYSVASLSTPKGDVMTFENDTVVGFVLNYPDAETLLAGWHSRCTEVLAAAQFLLRRLYTKAWNAYFLLLADQPSDYGQTIAMGAIEEDLAGTRKIARAGISTIAEVRSALLALLPIQNAPKLEPVDLSAEIRLRTSELPDEVMETFLSGAPEATVLQLLEADQ